MANFKVDAYNADRTEVEAQYSLTFTDASPAAPVALSATSPVGTMTSGTLPNTGAWVSGTAKVNPVSRDITVYLEIVGDASNNVASCVVALSPDNTTYTTLATPSLAAAVNNTGAITIPFAVRVPNGWYIKLTLTHVTVAASIYA